VMAHAGRLDIVVQLEAQQYPGLPLLIQSTCFSVEQVTEGRALAMKLHQYCRASPMSTLSSLWHLHIRVTSRYGIIGMT
jgi:hypothetical protein